MSRNFFVFAVFGGGALSTAAYYLYEHKRKLSKYPPKALDDMRAALYAQNKGNKAGAEKYFHSALHNCGENVWAKTTLLIKMADFYLQNNNPSRALLIYRSLLNNPEINQIIDDKMVLGIEKVFCDLIVDCHGPRKDFQQCQTVLSNRIKNSRNLNGDLGPLKETLGNIYMHLENTDCAIEAYKGALEACSDHLVRGTICNNIAGCFMLKGDRDEAIKYANISLKCLDQTIPNTENKEIILKIKENIKRITN